MSVLLYHYLEVQIIDFEALRLKSDLERRGRLRVLPGRDPEDAAVVAFPWALPGWAEDQVNGMRRDPDPGPAAA